MGNLNDAWGNRTVRLGVLAAFVATFVGLPALGQSLGSDAFKKLDAVNWMSSVFLAQDYSGGGSYTPPPSDGGSYVAPAYTAPTTTTYPTYTEPTSTYTAPTSTTPTYTAPTSTTPTYTAPTSTTPTYTAPTGDMSGSQYHPSGTAYPSGTQPTGTQGSMYPSTSGTQYPSGTQGSMYPSTSGTQYPSGTQPTGTQGSMYPSTSGTQYPSGTQPTGTQGSMYPSTSGTQYPSGTQPTGTQGSMYPSTSGTQYPSGTQPTGTQGTMYPSTSGTQYPSGMQPSGTQGTMYPSTSGTQYPSGMQPSGTQGSMYPSTSGTQYPSGSMYPSSGTVSPEQMKQNCEASGSKWENNACTGPAGAAFGQMGTQGQYGQSGQQYGQQGQMGTQSQYGQMGTQGTQGQMGQGYQPSMDQSYGQFNQSGQPNMVQPGTFEFKPFGDFSGQSGQMGGQFGGQGQMGQSGMPPPPMPAYFPQGDFGFQFGNQVFYTNFDSNDISEEHFGAAINEYGDFSQEFGDFEYDFSGGEGYDMEKFSQEVDKKEIERQKRDLKMQIKGQNEMPREFDRLGKRIDQFVKRLDQRLKQMTKDVERAKKQGGGDESGLDASVASIENLKGMVQKLVAELEVLKNLHASDLSTIQSSVENLAEGATFQDFEITRTNIRKLETYWPLRDAMDLRVSIIEQLEPAADLIAQIAQVRAQYAAKGVALPGDISSDLNTVESAANDLFSWREQAISLYEDFKSQASSIRALTNPEDINDAVNDLFSNQQDIQSLREDFQWASQDFHQSQPWETLRWAFEGLHSLGFQDQMMGELGGMKEEIGKASEVVALLKGLNLQNAGVQRAISDLSALVKQGLGMVEKMQAFLQGGGAAKDPGAMEQIFRNMDQLGMAADRSISIIAKYVDRNPAALDGLTSAEARLVVKFLNEGPSSGPGGPGGPGGFGEFENEGDYVQDQFRGAYAGLFEEGEEEIDMEALVASIRADLIEEVTRQVTEKVFEAMAALSVNDEVIAKVLGEFANNAKYLGKKANTLLEGTTAVLDRVTAVDLEVVAEEYDFEDEPELEDAFAELEEIQSEVKKTIIAESVEEDMKDYWTDVRATMESGASLKEVEALIEEGHELLENNEEVLFSEEKVQAKDMRIADGAAGLWYYGPMTNALQEGVISGYKDAEGNLTGEVKPGNPVTYGEALKMTFEAKGVELSNDLPSNPAVQNHWAAPYFAAAEKLGLDIAEVKDANAEAPREAIAVLVDQTFDLGGEEFQNEGTFTDVSGSSNVGSIEAVAAYGIMKGDTNAAGELTGTFRPDAPVLRAELAAVIVRTAESAGSVDDLKFDYEVEGGASLEEEEEFVPSEEGEAINFRKVSFWDFLKAMIPLFW